VTQKICTENNVQSNLRAVKKWMLWIFCVMLFKIFGFFFSVAMEYFPRTQKIGHLFTFLWHFQGCFILLFECLETIFPVFPVKLSYGLLNLCTFSRKMVAHGPEYPCGISLWNNGKAKNSPSLLKCGSQFQTFRLWNIFCSLTHESWLMQWIIMQLWLITSLFSSPVHL
jgi:hypothetical protein